MSQKRTLDAFFGPAAKKPRSDAEERQDGKTIEKSRHPQYPFPISDLPPSLINEVVTAPRARKPMNDRPDLDLVYFQPFMAANSARRLFDFLRSELPFYRVEYNIKRGGVDTHICTPRWTTVFGLDETSKFDQTGCVVDEKTGIKVSDKRYDRYPPQPIPKCLDELRKTTEAATDCKFNFCLVNYYASGSDSISFHSDDERFLGPDPAIASFSLGARRDFLLKHKPVAPGQPAPTTSQSHNLKIPLGSGDMVLMRGQTQSKWLHSIPKRTGKNQEDGGRINITFRKAMHRDGTENYYNYNVGSGAVHRWDQVRREMKVWPGTGV